MCGYWSGGEPFSSSIFNQPGREKTLRTERMRGGGPASMGTSLAYSMSNENMKHSRLRANFDAQPAPTASRSPTQGALQRSSSSPALERLPRHSMATAALFHAQEKAETDGARAVSPARLELPVRWYPHASTLRGQLSLSEPAKQQHGLDPLKDKTHDCGFWSTDNHRFEKVQALPGGRPKTPERALRWRHQESWQNSDNHPHWKVNHVRPSKTTDNLPVF